MAIFKGELTIDDILWKLPYKQMQELINSRQERLMEEEKMLDEAKANQEREDARNSILLP